MGRQRRIKPLPQAVATGAEFAIDLPQLGALGDMKVMVGVNGSGHDYWSNQFLAGLTPPQGNLGSDGTGAGNGIGRRRELQ